MELGPWALLLRAMLEAASMVELVFLLEALNLMQMVATATLATMTLMLHSTISNPVDMAPLATMHSMLRPTLSYPGDMAPLATMPLMMCPHTHALLARCHQPFSTRRFAASGWWT